MCIVWQALYGRHCTYVVIESSQRPYKVSIVISRWRNRGLEGLSDLGFVSCWLMMGRLGFEPFGLWPNLPVPFPLADRLEVAWAGDPPTISVLCPWENAIWVPTLQLVNELLAHGPFFSWGLLSVSGQHWDLSGSVLQWFSNCFFSSNPELMEDGLRNRGE